MIPKACTSFTPQKINTNQHLQQNQTNMKIAKMMWRPKRNKFKQSGACTKGKGTTYLYPANTWEVGHRSRLSEGVVWRWEEKRGLFGGSYLSFFRERYPAGMTSHPKEVSTSWDYLMYAIEIGDERAGSLSRWVKWKRREVKKWDKQFCLGMESGATNTI